MSFAEKYGPWAVIAGASEGTGREFARQAAARGVNCLLIARRREPLEALAEQIRSESRVECVPVSLDLSAPDACDRIIAAVDSREVGLYIANAGADPHGSHFLDLEIDTWLDLVRRNVLTTMRCCHHFGGLMRERRRGGLLLVSSGAAYGGGDFLATYSGSKAFEVSFAESLWSELRPFGVDVLCQVLVSTDTPAFRELLERKGQPIPARLASPEQVAQVGLARLGRGPSYNWGPFARWRAGWRRRRVGFVNTHAKSVFGERAV